MIVNPEVGDVFRSRAKVLSTIRRYLEDRGFLDIETPVLQVRCPLVEVSSATAVVDFPTGCHKVTIC